MSQNQESSREVDSYSAHLKISNVLKSSKSQAFRHSLKVSKIENTKNSGER